MNKLLLKKRVKQLRESDNSGECVLYIMSRDQRVHDNHALIAAQKHALAKKLPLLVVFNVLPNTGYRAKEHYEFMISGIKEIETSLSSLNIRFKLTHGTASKQINALIREYEPDAVYFDFNPLRGPQKLLHSLKDTVQGTSLYVVDTHNIVPAWLASDKQEYAAYTLRPKIHRLVEEFLTEPEAVVFHPYSWKLIIDNEIVYKTIETSLNNIQSSGITTEVRSGEHFAKEKLNNFITTSLVSYVEDRNDPTKDGQSGLSPYLHFGQLSSLRVALELRKLLIAIGEDLHIVNATTMPKGERGLKASVDALLEEMIVRKELADNFCYYEKHYKSLAGATDWARETIAKHDNDEREHLYSKEQLEHAKTHDPAWNAAQRQLTTTGKMHGYMRMYWAKKVKEWTPDAQTAIDILVELNDRYSLDGGDPNGYAGIMWSVCGVHDRPWTERDVFGKIRYMNYAGLQRKFDIKDYQNSLQ